MPYFYTYYNISAGKPLTSILALAELDKVKRINMIVMGAKIAADKHSSSCEKLAEESAARFSALKDEMIILTKKFEKNEKEIEALHIEAHNRESHLEDKHHSCELVHNDNDPVI